MPFASQKLQNRDDVKKRTPRQRKDAFFPFSLPKAQLQSSALGACPVVKSQLSSICTSYIYIILYVKIEVPAFWYFNVTERTRMTHGDTTPEFPGQLAVGRFQVGRPLKEGGASGEPSNCTLLRSDLQEGADC